MPEAATLCSVNRQVLRVAQAASNKGQLKNVTVLSTKDKAVSVAELLGAPVVKKAALADLSTAQNVDILIADQFLSSAGGVGKEGLDGASLDAFLVAALNAVREGGIVVVREDLSTVKDPSYTLPALTDYLDVFRRDIDGKYLGFDFYVAEQIEHSIHVSQNWLDFIWVLSKKAFEKPAEDSNTVTFRDFLDKTQYTNTGIGAYEWMFGKDFISPGGFDENLRVLSYFPKLEAGRTMLDIGSGIGGGVRQAAAVYGIHITGIDLSANMLKEAIVRVHNEKDSRVKYAITDVLAYEWPEESFDYAFSRDCIQHIPDTEKLFRNIYKALRPGGTVVISMYGRGAGEFTPQFSDYVQRRAYFLKNLKEIREFAEKVGFVDIYTENMTPRFKEILEEERAHLEKEKEDFFKNFSQQEYDGLISGWSSKLKYIEADNHNWNIFRATKPKH